MLKKILRLNVIIFIAITLLSCNKEDNPTEPSNSSNQSNPTGQPIPSFSDQSDYNGVMATLKYYQASLPGFPEIETSMAFAMFGSGVDAGTVSVNNNTLGKMNYSGKTMYIMPDPNNPLQYLNLSWNGSNHSWNVTGGSGIPAITGSVRSPNDFNVIQPVSNSTVSKSNGVQVRWSNTSTTSKMLIQIVSTGSGNVKYYQELSDNGSYTIPASDLSSFSGDCLLFVVRYNYSSTTVSGKRYFFVSEVIKSINIKLN
ncbi:MAG: hypothetical protein N2249_03705 [Melioribacter sp.]|nr:hypothetical protein [Melioribacter sp.]